MKGWFNLGTTNKSEWRKTGWWFISFISFHYGSRNEVNLCLVHALLLKLSCDPCGWSLTTESYHSLSSLLFDERLLPFSTCEHIQPFANSPVYLKLIHERLFSASQFDDKSHWPNASDKRNVFLISLCHFEVAGAGRCCQLFFLQGFRCNTVSW